MKIITIPVTSYAQNCSLIICRHSGKAAVIDPGGDIDKILDQAGKANCDIERILVTHGHFDHCGAALDLAEQLQIPIEGPHPDDDFLLKTLPEWARQSGFPPARVFTPNRWLHHGDLINVGASQLTTLHCPGHTPGHVVFFQPEANTAFVGDVLFRGSVGRSDLPRGNHRQLLESIHGRLLPLGDEVNFIPGHGPPSTLGRERISNPFLRR
jgi:hydroxyacylglutathione hydrolase